MHETNSLTIVLFAFLLYSCSAAEPSPPHAETEPANAQATRDRYKIAHTPARLATFHLRTHATATLLAVTRAEVKTTQSGQILSLPIREGSYVQAGALLAQLDPAAIQLRLEQAHLTLEEAKFNKNDLLVMQGGRWGVDSSVNETTLLSIHQQSGYKKALHAIKQLEYELTQTVISAPFTGMVAEVKARRYQHLSSGEILCTLIDPLSFEAVFQLLEKEAVQVKPGQKGKVYPPTDPALELRATVSTVNPVVDEHGLVRFHAAIHKDDLLRHRSCLLEGMNLRVVIEKNIPQQLVVPKSAVVLRSGRPVVFTYDAASGLAKWNYVAIAYENDSEAAISEGLKPGDLVIYEGNLNLDHDAEVEVQPKK